MKPIRTNRFLIILSALSSFAHGASLTWDGNGAVAPNPDGGTGTWDVNTSANWWDGAANVVWPVLGGTNDDAVFANTGGTVSLATGGVTANDITFSTTGYTIQTNTLTLNGTTPTVTTAPGVAATISSVIAGSAGLTKAGTGTLTLIGVNTYTAGTTISGGVLQIGDGTTTNGTVNGTFSIASGSSLVLNHKTAGGPPTWANISGAGTLGLKTAVNADTASWGTPALPVGFTGTLQIDGGRVTPSNATDRGLGGATAIVINAGGHFAMYQVVSGTITQNFTIAGTGYGEAGYESAIRMANVGQTNTISGNVALSANATLAAGNSGNAIGIISGVVSGAGGSALNLGTANQAGTVRLTNANNSYGGNTNVNFGTLEIGTAGRLGSGTYAGAITLASGATFNYNSTAAQALSGTISGAGSLTKNAASVLTLSGANTNTGAVTISGGTLKAGIASIANASGAFGNNNAITFGNTAGAIMDITGFNTQVGSLAGGGTTGGNITLGAVTLSTGGNNTNTSYAGVISGTGNLTKIGTGTQTLTGANTMTGVTTVSAGTLQFTVPAALYNNNPANWTAAKIVVSPAATLALTVGGTGFTSANVATIAGLGTATGGFVSGSFIGLDTTNGSFIYSSSLANPFAGANVLGLTKLGANSLTLSGASTYTGATTVSAGTLNVTSSLASPVTVNSGAILSGQGGSTSSSLTLAAGSSIYGVPGVAGAGNAFRAAGAVTAGSTVTILGSDGTTTTGSHTIDVLGYGTTPGTVNFNVSRYRSASLVDDTVNQKLTLTYTSDTKTWNSASSTWDGMVTNAWQEGDLKFSQGDTVTFNDTGTGGGAARAVTLNTVVVPSSVAFANSTSTYTISGTGSIGGGASVTKTGTGTVTLSTVNTYTGVTTINAGTLSVGSINNGGTPGGLGMATNAESNLVLGGGTLLYTGASASTDRNFTLTDGTTSTFNTTNTLTITGASAATTGALTKTGAGTLVFTGANANTGITTITAGTLQVGNGGSTGALGSGNVTDNATLSFNRTGSYSVANNIAGTGGITFSTVATGSPNLSGTLSVGSVTLGSFSNVTFSGTTANTTGPIVIDGSSAGVSTLILGKTAGTNAVTGDITMGHYGGSGRLELAASDQIADTSTVTLNAGGLYGHNSQFSLMGNNETIGWLQGTQSRGTNTVQNGGTVDSVLTLAGNTSSKTLQNTGGSGSVTVKDGSTGKLSIVKNGTGTQVFSIGTAFTASYSGTTTINAGILSFVGITFNTSPTILAGGTLNLTTATVNAAISGPTGQITVTGGTNSNFGGGNKTYSADTVLSAASTVLTQTAATSFSAASLHNVGTGSTLRTGNFAGSVKALTGAGAVDLNGASARLTLADGSAQDFSGIVGGAGGLTKAGSGTQTLSGTNAYTGTTIISGGVLQIGSGSTTGALAPASAITNNANLTINRSNAVAQGTDFGAISGTGSLTQSGAGTTTLTTNTYTGDTNVLGGQLDLSGTSIADTGKLVINGGKVGLGTSVNETVNSLYYGAVRKLPGTYGSTASAATNKDDSRFAGTGIVTVLAGSYEDWIAGYPSITGPNKLSSADADGDGFKNLMEFAFGTNPANPASGPVSWTGSVVNAHGQPTTSVTNIVNGVDFRAVFGRRLDYVAAGLTYTVQFSAGLDIWVNSIDVPSVLASDSEIDVVSVPYPLLIATGNGMEKPTFFRVVVTGP